VEHAGTVEGVAAGADGKLLATAGSEGKVRLWDARAGKELARLELDAPAWSVALDADSRYLAAGDQTWAIKVWEVARLLRRKVGR
jgi:WD40 repeat protein